MGARGGTVGSLLPGYGAMVVTTLPVVGGTQYILVVGGKGSDTDGGNAPGGYNGGGAAGTQDGSPGGGATDIRTTISLASRVVVAGGGGGADSYYNANGGSSGQNGLMGSNDWSGYGGTQTAGGAMGNNDAYDGALGLGGASNNLGGGGGGGGYYGGGGGYSSGGGGSSYVVSTGLSTTFTTGAGSSDGWASITLNALKTSIQKSTAVNVAHQSIFSELDVTGSSMLGGCSSWSSVLSGDLEPSSYFFSCANSSSAEAIVSYILTATSASDALSIGCDGQSWSAKRETAPEMTPLGVTATKTSITVTSRLSGKGSMYCGVYPHLAAKTQAVAPGSLTEILLQNHVGLSLNGNVSTVTISGLNAVSNYSVYCLAVSPSNTMTPLSTVLSSVRIVQTGCCKILDILVSVHNNATKSVVLSSVVPSLLTFTSSSPSL
eukprot:gene27636-34384_t